MSRAGYAIGQDLVDRAVEDHARERTARGSRVVRDPEPGGLARSHIVRAITPTAEPESGPSPARSRVLPSAFVLKALMSGTNPRGSFPSVQSLATNSWQHSVISIMRIACASGVDNADRSDLSSELVPLRAETDTFSPLDFWTSVHTKFAVVDSIGGTGAGQSTLMRARARCDWDFSAARSTRSTWAT